MEIKMNCADSSILVFKLIRNLHDTQPDVSQLEFMTILL